MKKHIASAALMLSAVMLFGSCSENKQQTKTDELISEIADQATAQDSSVSPVATASSASTSAGTTPKDTVSESEDWQISDLSNGSIDIDLTQMNATMIYSVIYDILINPDSYYGKSILVDGYFDTMMNDELGVRYYFIVVPDATACCVQGLEFTLPDGKVYPDDYPAVNENIRIKGVIDRYAEEGQYYTYIKTETLTVRQ
jgi:hypothetical protein